ncbi:MAG: hypothetical protein ABL933_14770 [Methyloglobulus sp.]
MKRPSQKALKGRDTPAMGIALRLWQRHETQALKGRDIPTQGVAL